jgi:hypothetical protein
MQSALGGRQSAWELSRQPEPWEHAVVETSHGSATKRHTGGGGDRGNLRTSRQGIGNDPDQFREVLAGRTHPRRLMTLEEVANNAV